MWHSYKENRFNIVHKSAFENTIILTPSWSVLLNTLCEIQFCFIWQNHGSGQVTLRSPVTPLPVWPALVCWTLSEFPLRVTPSAPEHSTSKDIYQGRLLARQVKCCLGHLCPMWEYCSSRFNSTFCSCSLLLGIVGGSSWWLGYLWPCPPCGCLAGLLASGFSLDWSLLFWTSEKWITGWTISGSLSLSVTQIKWK